MKSIHKILAMVLVVALVLAFVPGFEIPVTYASEIVGGGEIAEPVGTGAENPSATEGNDATAPSNGSDGDGLANPEDSGATEVSHLTEVPEGYTGIYTKADLDAVRNNLTGNYILMNDIVFTDADFAEGGDFYNGGKGWSPIGTDSSSSFSGTFDGNGYAIKNLYININSSSSVCAGLFGYSAGTIENLGMIDSDISVSVSSGSYSYVGGISGHADGSVANCYNTGNISSYSDSSNYGSSAKFYAYAGGIVGVALGTVKNCYNTGNVSANDNLGSAYPSAGGIVGVASGGSVSITDCYNMGNISAKHYAGGIFGVGIADVNSCYNTGVVSSAYECSGGIAGKFSMGTISSCYNAGNVRSVYEYAGGIVGYLETSAQVSNCYNAGSYSSVSGVAGGVVGYLYYGGVSNCYNVTSQFSVHGIIGDRYSYKHNYQYVYGGTVSNCYSLDNAVSSWSTECSMKEMMQQSTFAGFD